MDNGESSHARFTTDEETPNRARSGSADSDQKRNLPGSLLSRLSFLRMNQTSQSGPNQHRLGMEHDADGEDLRLALPRVAGDGAAASGSKAMSAALQQRRTRRRRGSLRKTALLGTRIELRDKRAAAVAAATTATATTKPSDSGRLHSDGQRSPRDPTSPDHGPTPRESFDDDDTADISQPSWFRSNTSQRPHRSSVARRRGVSQHKLLGEETGTDEEDLVSFLPTGSPGAGTNANNNTTITNNNNNNPTASTGTAAVLHRATPSSKTNAFYPLQPETAYRPVHRTKSSPLATHSVEMKSSSPDIAWDYSETEWWGWIILIVTWLVFVVGIGSCFEVWSWAWDVGETPYAPPELEDDPTLPIVGYYPALIILTAVMSWVWVVVAWVGMKYFKHANISGEDI
ncbi:hypothetical protein NUU61_006505 [Penicillium alfredii]|uniref:Uncharacterized protein n=1 Tax=Penicillium alfredii TaxID=1506179 RepID=A0A9W9K3P5_9EURO|nr:uncharacterized protein NUU61_006505 [Penicillium alfredii]KAJ5091635.1 hypothetical protein NUU61_006505 [Penicillium alfredii]